MGAIEEKIAGDLELILRAAEEHGTVNRLKEVAIYFDAIELRAIVRTLRASRDWEKPIFECPECGGDIAGAGHIVSCINARQ